MHTHRHTHRYYTDNTLYSHRRSEVRSIPEDAIPASSKPRGLPPKDIIEHICPEFILSCLRVAKQDKKVMLLWIPL